MQHLRPVLAAGIIVAAMGPAAMPASADTEDFIARVFGGIVLDIGPVIRPEIRRPRWNDDDD